MQDTKRTKNPRKQRKMLFNATAHVRHKLMGAPLSSELAASKGAKTLPVRKGDTIRIKRGDNRGFEGKVSRVDLKEYRIYVEGLTREKVDGTNIFTPVHPSKVEIRNLNLDDDWRKDILKRKKEIEKPQKTEELKAKPAEKVEKVPEKQKTKTKEVKEEKAMEAPPTEETVPEKVSEKIAEKVPKKAPASKKASKKKPIAKKPSTGKEVTAKKEKLAGKVASAKKEKAAAKKTAKPRKSKKTVGSQESSEETAAEKTIRKPRVKSKTSEKTEGGQ
jgi:large subunit ribosomal protein L24